VPGHTEAASAGLVRDTIEYRRLPWIRPLVEAVVRADASASPLFAGLPSDETAWREAIARVTAAPRDPDAIATVLQAQLTRRGAPAAALAGAADLASPDAVAVVTGQQAGLFGGPLYTLLKAVTTLQLARQVRARHGVPAVAVFWVDADDHDWAEVRAAHVLDATGLVVTVTSDDPPQAGSLPVGALRFDDRIAARVEDLRAALPPTEFTDELIATLAQHYRPGASPAAACAGWLETLLGSEGLVVFDASDPAAKRLASHVFARELSHPCETARLARLAGQQMQALGHAAQIIPADDVVCLFQVADNGRLAIRCQQNQVTAGSQPVDLAHLVQEAEAQPERFSANVLLRPIVQDTLFPTVCYVAGPSELAYHAQLGGVYAAFGVPRPLVAPRASATVLDGAALRFLERSGLTFEQLQSQDESALNRLLARQMPPQVESTFADLEETLTAWAGRLSEAAGAVDPTLAGAADTTVTRMRESVKALQGKILQAAKKKDDTLRRQFMRTRALVFPEGHPQERWLSLPVFINRFGPGFVGRLLEQLPADASAHYLIVP
jgi:bacillithiol biosynthesis cysteine-adding enzyme BshC